MCPSGILEPILWLPPKRTIHIICFSPNCSTSNWEPHGSISTNQDYTIPNDKMVILFESRAFQLERACPYHHFREFWFEFSLCSGYYYYSEGLLPQGTSSSCSHVVNPNYPGASSFLCCYSVLLNTFCFHSYKLKLRRKKLQERENNQNIRKGTRTKNSKTKPQASRTQREPKQITRIKTESFFFFSVEVDSVRCKSKKKERLKSITL